MRNILINTPKGRMTELQYRILVMIDLYPESPYQEVANVVGTSRMHVWRTRNQFLEGGSVRTKPDGRSTSASRQKSQKKKGTRGKSSV